MSRHLEGTAVAFALLCAGGCGGDGPPEGIVERCDGTDEDGDGTIDEEADSECTGDGVSAGECREGACVVLECESGLQDCNASFDDGCEARPQVDREHCGMCGQGCADGEACLAGFCQPVDATTLGSPGRDTVADIAATTEGTAAVTGDVGATIDVAGESLSPSGESAAFVSVLSDALMPEWASLVDSEAGSEARTVSTAASGDVWVGGRYATSASLGDSTLSTTNSSGFVARWSGDGVPELLADPAVASADGSIAWGWTGVVLPDSSGAWIAGTLDEVAAGGGPRKTFAARIDDDGSATWQTEQSGGSTISGALVGDSMWIAGSFEGSLRMDGELVTTAGDRDAFLSSFDGMGERATVAILGDADGDERVVAVASDDPARVYALVDHGEDKELVAMDDSGTIEWELALGDLHGVDIGLGSSNVFVIGRLGAEGVDIAGATVPPGTDEDVAIARVSPDGSLAGAVRLALPGDQYAGTSAIGAARLWIAGTFTDTLDIGGTAVDALGESDLMVLRLGLDAIP